MVKLSIIRHSQKQQTYYANGARMKNERIRGESADFYYIDEPEGLNCKEYTKTMFKIPMKMQKSYLKIKQDIDDYCETLIGRDVIWMFGRYKGRRAKIKNVTWDDCTWNGEEMEVQIIVDTYRLDGKGFLEWPKGSRCYMNVNEFKLL